MRFAFINSLDGEGALEWAIVGINSVPGALVCTGEDTVDNYDLANIANRLGELLGRQYDHIILSLTGVRAAYRLTQHLRSSGARLTIFVDGVTGRLEEIDYTQRSNYLDTLNAADFLLVNSESGKAYLESVIEDPGRLISIGLPINIELIEKRSWESIQEKDRIWLGYMYYRPSSNLFACMFMLKKLGLRGLIAGLDYRKTKDYYNQVIRQLGLADTIQLVPDLPQDKALEYMRQCGASLSMAVRDSLGRLAAEGAVCGVPAIGTANYFQDALFPGLTLKPFAFDDIGDMIGQAVEHCESYLDFAR